MGLPANAGGPLSYLGYGPFAARQSSLGDDLIAANP